MRGDLNVSGSGVEVPLRGGHRWGFGAFLLAEAVLLGASILVVAPFTAGNPALGTPEQPLPPAALLLSLIVPTVLAGLVALIASRTRGRGPVADFGLRPSRRDVRVGLGWGIGGLALTIPASLLWVELVGQGEAASAVSTLLGDVRLQPAVAVALFLHVWLLAPFCEELVFRGLLWGAAERQGWPPWGAFALTTAVFAIAHLEPLRTLLLVVVALPIGAARYLTGSLPAAIIAHQVNNFLPAVALLLSLLGTMPEA